MCQDDARRNKAEQATCTRPAAIMAYMHKLRYWQQHAKPAVSLSVTRQNSQRSLRRTHPKSNNIRTELVLLTRAVPGYK